MYIAIRGDTIFSVAKSSAVRQHLPSALLPILSDAVFSAADSLSEYGKIQEIRLRSALPCSVIADGRNLIMPISLSSVDLNLILSRLCGGSLYAFTESINRGFVPFHGGIRVGVVGHASVENGKIIGIYDISSLSIRIPSECAGVGLKLSSIIRSDMQGMLIYSPPGVGKTTLLRGIISELSAGDNPLRVAVIDTRAELSAFVRGTADILTGYPRGIGIEIATRTMNPQVIVCDEIGEIEEARQLICACNCGIPIIASAHARNISELTMRGGIKILHRAGIFGRYVGIRRNGSGGFFYDIVSRGEINDMD